MIQDDGVSAIRAFDLQNDCLWSDIRQRYRQLIGQFHPDKVQHLGDELQKLAAQKTKEYVSAFELLEQFFSKN